MKCRKINHENTKYHIDYENKIHIYIKVIGTTISFTKSKVTKLMD